MKPNKKMFKPFDAYEEELMKHTERGDYHPESIKDEKELIRQIRLATHQDVEERRHQISLRVPVKDLQALKEKAEHVGIPYQSIISALIHQYITGKVKLDT